MDKVLTGVLAVAAIVLSGAIGILGFTVPSMWTLQSDVGGIKINIQNIDKRLDTIEKKLDGINEKLIDIAKRTEVIDVRLSQKESDPSSIVSMAGLRPISEFSGISVNGKLYVLPKSDQAMAELANAGLKREAIAPTAFGYVLGTYDPSGALIFQTGSASFTPQEQTVPIPPKAPRRDRQ